LTEATSKFGCAGPCAQAIPTVNKVAANAPECLT
jgi:hypothetical protein